jgi:hypothetical protein
MGQFNVIRIRGFNGILKKPSYLNERDRFKDTDVVGNKILKYKK